MVMLGIICDCNGTGRKTHHVIRRRLIREGIPPHKELTIKLKFLYDPLGFNRANAKTKAITIFTVSNQTRQRFLCHIKSPSLVQPKIRPHLNLLKTGRVDIVYLLFIELTRTTD